MFSANLRLPSGITLEEKKLKVDETVEELGLTLCQDSKVTTTSGKICRKVFSNRRYALINRGPQSNVAVSLVQRTIED